MPRHTAIVHWSEIERPDRHYSGDDELMNNNAPLAQHFGLKRIGIHHERLQPGRRTSYPHAESTEDEFVYVIAGTPDVWLDGELHRLRPGDSVGFPAGDGLCHSFLNNTEIDVELLVIGDANRNDNRIYYALNPERKAMRDDWWEDWPARPLGGHDGLPDKVREWRKGK
jgi:uncharacterized cupin superfamily protein